MTAQESGPARPPDHPYLAEIDLERTRWYELTAVCRSLEPDEREKHGYYRDPDWSVKDLVGHIGVWLAKAHVCLEQIAAGTYEGAEVDVHAMNAHALSALHDQPWDVVWTQAHAARTMMLRAWYGLAHRSAEADRWVAKAGADHYDEHLPRLHAWISAMVARRGA